MIVSFVLASMALTPAAHTGAMNPLDRWLDAERALCDPSTRDLARERGARHLVALDECSGDREAVARCVVARLFGPEGLSGVVAADEEPQRATICHALTTSRGTCAALVATALALTEATGSPFEAVVFPDHVALGLRDSPQVIFETLEHGRQLRPSDLPTRKAMDAPPLRVATEGYLAYHHDNLASRLAQAGRLDEAEAMFRRGIQIDPHVARLRYNLGTMLLEQGRNAESLTELDLAVKRGQRDAYAFINRGVARWRVGQLRGAEKDFARALRLEPHNHDAAENLAAVREARRPPKPATRR